MELEAGPHSKSHPLVEEALSYAQTRDEKTLTIDDQAIKRLTTSLAAYYGKKELLPAIAGLLDLARAFGDAGSIPAAVAIVRVVASAKDALIALGSIARDALERVDTVAKRYEQLCGAEPQGQTSGLRAPEKKARARQDDPMKAPELTNASGEDLDALGSL